MLTFYICGYPRNQNGEIRKNAKRKILDIAHSKEEAAERVLVCRKTYQNKYDLRIFDGGWKEIKE